MATRKQFTPSANDLQLLTEHLCYELQMTFDGAAFLLSGRPRAHPVIHNAVIETFPVHVRQLIDYFWNQRTPRSKAQEDAFAADYFDPGVWAALRPKRPAGLDAVWKKTGWGVVHLTYGRANSTAKDRIWDHVAICDELLPVVETFIAKVDASKLDPQWFREIQVCVARYTVFRSKRP